jgi:hypothetical protein
LWAVTYKGYQYSFDVDGTAYMTLAQRLSGGDWFKSINGLWSPLNPFIASFFIKFISNPVLIFKIINALCSAGIILMTGKLCTRFLKSSLLINGILLILPFIFLAYTHEQLAGDLLSLLLLLIYCGLITTKGFFESKRLNIYSGMIMALAYFAKSYCLPFFLLNHTLLFLWHYYNFKKNGVSKPIFKNLFLAFFISFFIILPWIYLLFLKYNRVTISNAGILNYNWFLGNGPATQKNYGLLIPPPYADATNFWEDPYSYYNYFLGPFSSITNFLKAIKLFFHTLKVSFSQLAAISYFLISIYAYWLIRMGLNKSREKFFLFSLLLITAVTQVAGYLLIHIETRYIWMTGIIGLIAGAMILEEKMPVHNRSLKWTRIVVTLYLASFLINPAEQLKDLNGSGKDLYEAAHFLATNDYTGNFTSNYSTNAQSSWCTKLAFLSQNPFFILSKNDYTSSELLQAIQENKIRFYLYFYTTPFEKENFLSSTLAQSALQINTIPNKKILLLKLQ